MAGNSRLKITLYGHDLIRTVDEEFDGEAVEGNNIHEDDESQAPKQIVGASDEQNPASPRPQPRNDDRGEESLHFSGSNSAGDVFERPSNNIYSSTRDGSAISSSTSGACDALVVSDNNSAISSCPVSASAAISSVAEITRLVLSATPKSAGLLC